MSADSGVLSARRTISHSSRKEIPRSDGRGMAVLDCVAGRRNRACSVAAHTLISFLGRLTRVLVCPANVTQTRECIQLFRCYFSTLRIRQSFSIHHIKCSIHLSLHHQATHHAASLRLGSIVRSSPLLIRGYHPAIVRLHPILVRYLVSLIGHWVFQSISSDSFKGRVTICGCASGECVTFQAVAGGDMHH